MADLEFARRLARACDECPSVPAMGRGRLMWLHRQLGVSNESVRKWMAGESCPRPKSMKELAATLNVDQAWLALGVTPSGSPRERRARNARATGAANMFMGIVQMNGASVAVPEEDDPLFDLADFYAIIESRHRPFCVVQGEVCEVGSDIVLNLPLVKDKLTVVCAFPTSDMSCEFVILPMAAIMDRGRHLGGYIELTVHRSSNGYSVQGQECPAIRDFEFLQTYKEL